MEAWRVTGDPGVASPIIYKGRRRLALRHRSGAKRRVGTPVPWEVCELRPYERSRCAEPGGELCWCHGGVPAPPGVVMLAPSEAARNAEGAQSEGRAERSMEKRGQGHCKGRSPLAMEAPTL
jgi:hypothetical protein